MSFSVGDLLGDARADAVLANLPYVADGAELIDDVARYEPVGALRGGADGLDPIRRLTGAIAARPPTGRPALLALEIGADQGRPWRRWSRPRATGAFVFRPIWRAWIDS